MEKEIPTAEDFYLKTILPTSFENKHDEVKLWFETDSHGKQNVNIMIEFAKLHVEKIMNLQQAKYYAGETGYIKKEEWEEIINNIK